MSISMQHNIVPLNLAAVFFLVFSFKCWELSSGSLKALPILPLLALYKISSLATDLTADH